MAASQTDRLEIFTWNSGTDTFTRAQMNTSHTQLETVAAGFDQTGASVPTAKAIAKYKGYFHYSTSTSTAGVLRYCNGAAWFEVGRPGTAVQMDGTLSDGTSTDLARADHKHSIADNTITTGMIQDQAVETAKIDDLGVTTAKIADDAVTDAKLAASGLDISRMTTGTLDVGRIGAGTILNAKLGSDIDASKITDGTLPIARIAESAVTHEKIEDSVANSVIGRATNSGGVVADISASTPGHVLRLSGSTLGFGTIATEGIAANAVTVDKIEEVAAHGILARVAGTGGDLSELAATDDTVLGKLSGNNLAFGKVTNAQLDGNITKDKISSVNASAIDGTIAVGKLPTDIALGGNTTGNYAAAVAVSGSGLDISGSAGEGTTFTLSHANTSSQADSNNSDGTVIQSVGLDGFGHVDSLDEVDLDDRYYEKADARGLFTDSTRKTYGGSTSSSTRNSNAYHNIFVTGSEPTNTNAKAGDIWFET